MKEYNWNKAFQTAFEGDRTLLDDLCLKAYTEVLVPYVRAKTGSVSDADVIACEVMAKFWERFYILKEPLPENVNGYIYTMGMNKIFSHYKMRRTLRDFEINYDPTDLMLIFSQANNSVATDMEDIKEKEGMYAAMEAAFSKLCESCAALLRMSYLENRKLKDIHLELNIPTSNAASKMKIRCLNKLVKFAYHELTNQEANKEIQY